MSDPQSNGNGTGPRRRRGKRFLSPSEKYEIWVSLIRGEYTIAAAAEQAGVDRSTVVKLRSVARQGALEALASSKPGVRGGSGADPELAAAKAEIARLSEALKEMGVRLMLAEGKGRWD
jgi:transposase